MFVLIAERLVAGLQLVHLPVLFLGLSHILSSEHKCHPQSVPNVKYANISPPRGTRIETASMILRTLTLLPFHTSPPQLSVNKSFLSFRFLCSNLCSARCLAATAQGAQSEAACKVCLSLVCYNGRMLADAWHVLAKLPNRIFYLAYL